MRPLDKSTAIVCATQAVLAAFFGFVGYMKAFASMSDLAQFHAWVAALPVPLARTVGWSEMLCALGLVLPGLLNRGRWIMAVAAELLVLNQVIAIIVHGYRGELAGAFLQNVLLILLLAFVSLEWRKRDSPIPRTES